MENVELTKQDLKEIFAYINGKTPDGYPKMSALYRCFILDDEDEARARREQNGFHHTDKAVVQMSLHTQNPDWYVLDLVFYSYQEPELKLLWGYLQRYLKYQADYPEKDTIFDLVLTKNNTVDPMDPSPKIFSVNAVCPVVAFLMPEVPDMGGANVVRMLFDARCIRFSYARNEEYEGMRGEMQRQAEEARYINEGAQENGFDSTAL